MNLNLNSTILIACIFIVSLGVFYLIFRIIYSGPIKISEHGTKKYILTIILIIILAIILTVFIVFKYKILLNFNFFNT